MKFRSANDFLMPIKFHYDSRATIKRVNTVNVVCEVLKASGVLIDSLHSKDLMAHGPIEAASAASSLAENSKFSMKTEVEFDF